MELCLAPQITVPFRKVIVPMMVRLIANFGVNGGDAPEWKNTVISLPCDTCNNMLFMLLFATKTDTCAYFASLFSAVSR